MIQPEPLWQAAEASSQDDDVDNEAAQLNSDCSLAAKCW